MCTKKWSVRGGEELALLLGGQELREAAVLSVPVPTGGYSTVVQPFVWRSTVKLAFKYVPVSYVARPEGHATFQKY